MVREKKPTVNSSKNMPAIILAMAELAPADVPAACQQNQPACNARDAVLDTKLNQAVVAVRNINAIVPRVATQHIAEGLFARPHSRRMFAHQFPALMEEARATAVGVVHWTTEIVSRYCSVGFVIAKLVKGAFQPVTASSSRLCQRGSVFQEA